MLGVAMEERHPLFPDVPTFKEKGIDLVGGAYRGVAVPADVPEDMRRQISEVFVNINKQPSFVEKMEEGGYVLVNVGYDEVPAFMEKLGKEKIGSEWLRESVWHEREIPWLTVSLKKK